MNREIIRLWSGPVLNIPKNSEEAEAPKECANAAVYSDGSRVYDKGLMESETAQERLSFIMSRCWDSLKEKDKQI
jgi:hypothetical protein